MWKINDHQFGKEFVSFFGTYDDSIGFVHIVFEPHRECDDSTLFDTEDEDGTPAYSEEENAKLIKAVSDYAEENGFRDCIYL